MEKITTITYKGNCPRCGKEQVDESSKKVDIDCWDCSVNVNLERHDIMRDIAAAIKDADMFYERAGLQTALEIIQKYDHWRMITSIARNQRPRTKVRGMG